MCNVGDFFKVVFNSKIDSETDVDLTLLAPLGAIGVYFKSSLIPSLK